MTARIRRRFDPLFWPRFALGLLAISKKVRTDAHAGPAVYPAASGRIPAAGNSFDFRGALGSHATDGAQVAGQSGLGADSFNPPVHEDASR